MTRNYLALDVGERRIGVAKGDDMIRIPIPLPAIEVDGSELESIKKLIADETINAVVVGYPRNQSGEPTAQTVFVEEFSQKLQPIAPRIEFQDESLTSVLAEERLKASKKPYTKGDIDSQAAAIILHDYLERR